MRPSLNDRIKAAAALTDTVLQLHTAGWLHKSIRSANVLLFPSTQTTSSQEYHLPPAFLGGYEFARLDSTTESTKAPGTFEPLLLYRHPLSLSEDRDPYCKAFDLYSLGCVLLEIGLWWPLLTMIIHWAEHIAGGAEDASYRLPPRSTVLRPSSAAEWRAVLQNKADVLQSAQNGNIAAQLQFYMGETYAWVVKQCLNAASRLSHNVILDADDSKILLTPQITLLRTLTNLLDHI